MRMRRGLAGLGFAAAAALVTGAGCTPPGSGNVTAGETKFNASCATCHSAASLRGTASLVTNDLGTLAPQMAGITLTDQEVADIQAFLATQ